MMRRFVLLAFALALCGQAALTGRAWWTVMATPSGPSLAQHLAMHALHESHHHHDRDGSVHRDHSLHSAHHVAGDGCSTPLASASHTDLPQACPLAHAMPQQPSPRRHRSPFLEGLMRPPARATA